MTKEDIEKWNDWIVQWDDDPEHQLDPDCELAAAYGQIAKLESDKKELELNLQVFERQWLLYKQKSDKAIEEILKLRNEINDNNIEINNKTIKLHHQAEKIAKLEEFHKTRDQADAYTDKLLKEKEQEINKLTTALEWYAEKGNMELFIGTSEHHNDLDHWFNCWMMSPVTDKARKALGMKTETEELLNGREGIHGGNTG